MPRTIEWYLIIMGVTAAFFAPEIATQTGWSLLTLRMVLGLAILVLIVRAWLFPPAPALMQQLEWTATKTPHSPEEYKKLNLGPLSTEAAGRELYIDLLQRTLINVIYEDVSMMFYDELKVPHLAKGFEISNRIAGKDVPWQAHTMVGLHRLQNLRECVETLIKDKVPGDLVELGVLRGGASIFLRGLLKAHGDSQRKVFACDTYCAREPTAGWHRAMLFPVVSFLAKIPSQAWRRLLFTRVLQTLRSFPLPENPSDDLVNALVFGVEQAELMSWHRGTSVAEVKSHFARYGLWDDQVVMLEGFFSDTLPKAAIQKVALMRLDGDTYESTRDVLNLLYDKLSPGGFCVVDDYGAFVDCQRAIEEFRTARGITSPIVKIDQFGVYWRNS